MRECSGSGVSLRVIIAWLGVVASASVFAQSAEQEMFWGNLSALCGNSYRGEIVEYDPSSDQGWLGKEVVIHAKHCSEHLIRIALNVGEDRSRTWVLTRMDDALELKHDHRHEDGSEDRVSWYGGRTGDSGRAWRQAFVVDGYSKSLFYAEGLDVSAQNIWYFELQPQNKMAYGLTRPNRHFRVEFDLSLPTATPPPSWGDNDR